MAEININKEWIREAVQPVIDDVKANYIPKSVIEDIRKEIANLTFTGECEGYQLGFNYGLMKAVEIIDAHIKAVEI